MKRARNVVPLVVSIVVFLLLTVDVRGQPGERLTVWHAWEGAASDALRERAQAFERSAGIGVELVPFATPAELLARLRSAGTAGDGPDVFFGPHTWQAELLDLGLIAGYCLPGQCPACEGPTPPAWCPFAQGEAGEDLNAEFLMDARYCERNGCPQCEGPDAAPWCPRATAGARAEIDVFQAAFSTWDAGLERILRYGIPIWWEYAGIFANPARLEAAGLELPATLRESARLADATGGAYLDADFFARTGLTVPGGIRGDAGIDPSRAALLVAGSSAFAALRDEARALVPLRLDDYAPEVVVHGSYLRAGGASPQEALDFMYFMAEEETQKLLFELAGALPVHARVLADLRGDLSELVAVGLGGTLPFTPLSPTVARGALVRGYLAARLLERFDPDDPQGVRQAGHQVFVPSIKVFLRNLLDGSETDTNITDLSGRFTLAAPAVGRYRVCWSGQGFVDDCSQEIFSVASANVHVSTLHITPERRPDSTTVYGRVTLADGTRPRMLEPLVNVNGIARVAVIDSGGAGLQEVLVNDFGEYLLPVVPARERIRLRVSAEGATTEQAVFPDANLYLLPSHRIDLVLANTPPRLVPVVPRDAGGRFVRVAAPGDEIRLEAIATDADGDALGYRWLAQAGSGTLDATTGPAVTWRLPDAPGAYRVSLVAYDGRGGYAESEVLVRADTRGVPFSGRVRGSDGPAIAGAEVEVNGRTTTTDPAGYFQLFAEDADRFVLNIRSPGYALVSRIYDKALTGGLWIMTRATTVSADPAQPILVTDRREPGTCPGPYSLQLDWDAFPGLRQARFSDGQGRLVRIGGLGTSFEDQTLGAGFRVGDAFLDAGTTVGLRPFTLPNGDVFADGFGQVGDRGLAQGSGNEFAVNNVNLSFSFGGVPSQLSVRFGEYGGSVNLEINGDLAAVEDFAELDGRTLGGVTVRVSPASGQVGQLRLSGPVRSLAIGGQELWIDDVVEEVVPMLPVDRGCGPGLQVSIPANALVDADGNAPTGNVDVSVSTVDLMSPEQMPGDYSVAMPDGSVQVMQSYAAGTVEIGAGGTEYDLGPGMTAQLTFPIDPSQLAAGGPLPATIPLLFYDEAEGVWLPEGEATLQGTTYVAEVSHFSAVNTDLIKTDQSCVRILSPTLPASYKLEYTIPAPAGGGAAPIVRLTDITNTAPHQHVIYNLPSNTNIVLVPIRIDPDPAINNTPFGTFVVNTGGPQNPTDPNRPAGPPYDACSTEVTLADVALPAEPLFGNEFLHGLTTFEATNLTELDAASPADVALAQALQQATENYYTQVDPRNRRTTLADFKNVNGFAAGETRASFANSGDLGFGRDMHCTKQLADDGQFDVACYVTNYGDNTTPDLQDALDAGAAGVGSGAEPPVATVAMEYSRIESPPGDPVEFDDPDRVVKFFVYKGGDATPAAVAVTEDGNGDGTPDQYLTSADLDGFGARPIPQLCMVCHGGAYPGGPVTGAAAPFDDRDDVKLGSLFLPFDAHFYTFPPAPNDKAAQQDELKALNEDIVAATDPGTEILEVISEMYAGLDPNVQLEDFVVAGWDSQPIDRGMYRDVVARGCRTCHVGNPFTGNATSPSLKFDAADQIIQRLGATENRVCSQYVMPHAAVTYRIFWTSVGPHMPAQLQVFGDVYGGPDWSGEICGEFTPGGATPVLFYDANIQPIWNNHCTACHIGGSPPAGLNLSAASSYANLVGVASTELGTMNRIQPNDPNNSYLYLKITNAHAAAGGTGDHMPPSYVGDPLSVIDPGAVTTIQNWINGGATP